MKAYLKRLLHQHLWSRPFVRDRQTLRYCTRCLVWQSMVIVISRLPGKLKSTVKIIWQ